MKRLFISILALLAACAPEQSVSTDGTPTDSIPYTDAQLVVIAQARDTLLACDKAIQMKAPKARLGYYIYGSNLVFRECESRRDNSAAHCNLSEYVGEKRYGRMLAAIDTLKKLRIIGAWYTAYSPDSSDDLVLTIDTNYQNHGDGRYLATHALTGFDLEAKRGKFVYLRDQL